MSDPLSPTLSGPSLPDLIARARATDGSPPFSDGALVELRQGTASLIWLDDAAAIVSADTSAEFVVDPDARRRGLGTRMLEHLTSRAAGDLLFWAHGDHPGARALAASHGLDAARTLLHLEADVPPDESSDLDVSPIRLPEEGDAWLKLNALAFAGHPEQGRMTRADLETTIAEPWFDADDFLVLRHDGAIIGFCWLKVESAAEGEFYVVGVDPRRQGERLGRRLVEAGMARLASRGIHTAHLYVEGDNAPALQLYRGIGFTNRSVDVQYRWVARG
ncbi:mycothiol synthase [Salinibacterium sp. G-O1]|uniref:mycothiol synthase n=1 Tax=Salinibacterium sp. G-O1 TaxID=3046208 RepID=UPI0024BA9C9C|nr:mycothiol synthase [Salinibacterium sp. G-O1]MDJ0336009.1 mycothiol synthase [Salinibacterium sp. G-O1]